MGVDPTVIPSVSQDASRTGMGGQTNILTDTGMDDALPTEMPERPSAPPGAPGSPGSPGSPAATQARLAPVVYPPETLPQGVSFDAQTGLFQANIRSKAGKFI